MLISVTLGNEISAGFPCSLFTFQHKKRFKIIEELLKKHSNTKWKSSLKALQGNITNELFGHGFHHENNHFISDTLLSWVIPMKQEKMFTHWLMSNTIILSQYWKPVYVCRLFVLKPTKIVLPNCLEKYWTVIVFWKIHICRSGSTNFRLYQSSGSHVLSKVNAKFC